MGYIAHDAVIVTYGLWAAERVDVPAFREQLPEDLRPLLVGPIKSPAEGYLTWFFGPDGSKEDWPESDEGDRWRERFVKLFTFRHEDGSSPFEVISVTYGGDFSREHGVGVRELHPESAVSDE